MTATRLSPPGALSSARIILPSTGRLPSAEKKSPETIAPETCSGSSSPVRLKLQGRNAEIFSMDFDSRSISR